MVAILLTVALGGCGGGSVNPADVTLSVRPEGSPERRLLGQIYAQALRATGYKVKEAPPETFANSSGMEAVKAGKVSGYAEYLSTTLFYDFGVEIEDIPTKVQAAYAQTEKNLEKKGLTALPPTPYGIENAVGMLSRTAERRGLKKNSDLKGQAEEMTLKGPTYCHVSVECLGGIERHYNTAFESISYERGLAAELSWSRPEPDWRYEVLEDGESDASILYTTDGRLANEGDRFVILEDDKHIFPASNVVWVTSPEVVDEAGSEYEKAIARAQKGLTIKAMQELNAKLEQGGKPATVAAEYLKSIHYTG